MVKTVFPAYLLPNPVQYFPSLNSLLGTHQSTKHCVASKISLGNVASSLFFQELLLALPGSPSLSLSEVPWCIFSSELTQGAL